MRVHRPRYSGKDTPIDTDKSMSATNEGLMQSEKLQVAFYPDMDSGPDFIRLFQSTATQTTTPVELTRYPRFIADYLNGKCAVDVSQLQRVERQLGLTVNDASSALFGLPIAAVFAGFMEMAAREKAGLRRPAFLSDWSGKAA